MKRQSSLQLEALVPSNFEAFAQFLGSACFGGCFCAVWRSFDDTWAARCADPTRPNLEISRQNVNAGHHIGFLVYQNNALVGWVGAGPKTSYPQLQSKLASRLSEFSNDLWSIGCLAIAPAQRGRGLPEAIVQDVVELAKASGAALIEAYPVRPWDEGRSYRGSHTLYERLDFHSAGVERDGDFEVLLMQRRLSENIPLVPIS